ncbi:hypothetical protein OIU74_007765 [Salix koriyanagi]|uniref:Uncharacterized protein n=1 Tax=Salix koriyanagi TaxID=2511006 RepID=A0A9Q0U4H2_9ROSI|nr:hypothetical protein OIU74_007765 [Salix koriyanagi]
MMAEENGLEGDARIHQASTSSPNNDDERHLGSNGKNQEEPENSKEDEKSKSVPFFKLFSFSDSTDFLLMFFGNTWCNWEWPGHACYDFTVGRRDRCIWK